MVIRDGKSDPIFTMELAMKHSAPQPAVESRQARIDAIMEQLRPKIDEAVRKMVERAVDVPEAEEFGAIDFEFRDAGLKLTNEVRQATVASRKKGLHRLQPELPALRLCGQIPFVSAAAGAHRARRGASRAGLLLLRSLQAELLAL
jgi:hypothetical protein